MSSLLTYLTKTKPEEVILFYSEVLDFLIEFNSTSAIDEIEFLIDSFDSHYPGDLLDSIDDIIIPAIHVAIADYGIVVDLEQVTKVDWFMLANAIYSIQTSPYLEVIKDEAELTESDREMIVNIIINHSTMDEFRCNELIKYVSALLRSRMISLVESLEFKMPEVAALEHDAVRVGALKKMVKTSPPPQWTIDLITERQLLPGQSIHLLIQLIKQSYSEFSKMEPRLAANEMVMCAILSSQPIGDKFKVAKKLTSLIFQDATYVGQVGEILDQMVEV